ncbi:hypothetical protein OHC33_000648 [Knufia fluminis]|uniref:Uncharacterized protein n=1 Tax=Knufia fluminis TaxID=191047 RepID=A0AAN8ICN0_9EURO|nr:hypothetical protein OHC33_000648 [Knufia fluminis]
MSSYLFYSSPPPAAYNQQQQTPFFTPQAHRTNPFSAWPSFQPKSPSPLRKSHANVVRQQPYYTSAKSLGFDVGDENSMQENSNNNEHTHLHNPFLDGTSTIDIQTQASATPATEHQNIFSAFAPPPSTTTKTPFQFQQRARDSSAQSLLSARTSAARSERKSAFVNRLRNTRRGSRDDRQVESFEKAEYWRERRLREERMQRDAMRVMGGVEEEVPDMDMETGQLSPVSEEKEVQELVEAYYGYETGQQQEEPVMDDNDNENESFEDDLDYEEAFMEVLSQEGMGRSDRDLFGQQLSSSGGGQAQSNGQISSLRNVQDGDMDMT